MNLRSLLQDDDPNAWRVFEQHEALLSESLQDKFTAFKNAMRTFALDEALELLDSIDSA